MTDHETRYRVLPEYTDGRLNVEAADMNRSPARRRAARSLLGIQPEWRQSVWAAAHASLPEGNRIGGDRFDGEMLAREITAMTTRFLVGYRPRRMETPLTTEDVPVNAGSAS